MFDNLIIILKNWSWTSDEKDRHSNSSLKGR